MQSRTAADIMDSSELTLTPEIALVTAMRTLLRSKVTGAPVIDADGRICGMLTEKDCLSAVLRQAMEGAPGATVGDFMTSPAETVSPSAQLLDITRIFLSRPFRKIPVVDADGRVLGQVSRRDLLRALESDKDNPFLYGTADHTAQDTGGVHSAMQRALGKS
ncbi:MAG: CBS domain-containing protein [Myxococcota bacterium]